MSKCFSRSALIRFWLPGAALLQFGGCLTDQQWTSILQSAISTGLNTIIAGLASGAGA